MMNIPEITAMFDGGHTSKGDALLTITPVIESRGDAFIEYHAELTSHSDSDIFLEEVTLFRTASLSDCGLEPPFDVFRSGRHKNDLPGVFTTGIKDERLRDVAAVMAESGDGLEGKSDCRIQSDHLTLFRDREGKVLAVEFLTGRDQLFETVIRLDETGELE